MIPSPLKEPLLHFFALGALVFAAYGWLSSNPATDEIVVTRGQQTNLIDTFERTWRRPPTTEEFRGLVEDFIRQEIAYREGSSMELDRDDIVIRRRLRQKLELLTEDLATLAPPTETETRAYYEANAERFRIDARFSFEQIYFSTDRRGSAAETDALALLPGLQGGSVTGDVHAFGDATALPLEVRDASRAEVAATFGGQFADALAALMPGDWGGPVASGYGLHLVRVSARTDSRVPPLEEVSDDVRNELVFERRRAAVEGLYETLAESYTIRVEPLAEPAVADPNGVADAADE